MLKHRITFRLSRSLAAHFEEKALKSGLTKAKLLRDWLQVTPDHFQLSSVPHNDNTTSFTFHLNANDWKKLNHLSQSLGLSKTKVLQLIINNQVQGTQPSVALVNNKESHIDEVIKSLWNQGYLDQLKNHACNDLESLSSDQIFLVIQSNLELGNFHEVKEQLALLNTKPGRGLYYRCKQLICEAHYLVHCQRNLLTSKQTIDEAIALAEQLQDRELLGITNRINGEIYFYNDQPERALHAHQRALDYLDPIIYRHHFLRTLLDMIKIYIGQHNWLMAELYAAKTADILQRNPNIYFQSWYERHQALYHLVKGNLTESSYYLNKSLTNVTLSNSIWALTVLNLKGKILITQHKTAEASQLFEDAFTFDRLLRPTSSFSRAKLYALYMRTAAHYENSIQELEKLTESNAQSVESSLGKYVLNTARYLYSPLGADQIKGEAGLKQLSSVGSYQSLRHAALKTLSTHEIQPVL
ncbi:MAG TPA: hypothetical protein VD999_00355 [Vitreimonas sp.]|nr:hypothetical protein [Vitreimonas sp.]